MDKQRARNEAEKQTRYAEIITAAITLLEESGYNYSAITMAEVAQQASLSKGAVYLYFKTKEEVFLEVQTGQFQAWFDDVDSRLQAVQTNCTVRQLRELLVSSLENRTGFVRLIAIVHSNLEQNLDFATALRFKTMLRKRVLNTGQLLESRLSFLRPGQGSQLLLRIYALAIGLQHVSHPAPIVSEVLQTHPEMNLFEIDFTHEFSETLQLLLAGYADQAAQGEKK